MEYKIKNLKKSGIMIVVFLILLTTCPYLMAQDKAVDDKRTVGIVQFDCEVNDYCNKASELHEIVAELFTTKKYLQSLDPSKTSHLNEELIRQKQGTSINSTLLVEQGKQAGAQDIIQGTLTSLDGIYHNGSSGVPFGGGLGNLASSGPYFTGKLIFSIQITDVETGKIKSSKVFDFSNGEVFVHKNSKEDAINSIIQDNKSEIIKKLNNWINEVYPPPLKITSIDDRDKKSSYPILVTVLGGSDANIKEGNEIILQEDNKVTVDGVIRDKTNDFGMLEVKKVNGDFMSCKVTKGKEQLEATINAKTLKLIIKRKY